MVRVAILGATGYSAKEAIRLLLAHPHVQITALTTRQDDQPHLGDVHPSLRGRLDLKLENLSAAQLAERDLAPGDVRLIVLSHLHGDHVAGLLDFTDARIVVGPGELPPDWRKAPRLRPRQCGTLLQQPHSQILGSIDNLVIGRKPAIGDAQPKL